MSGIQDENKSVASVAETAVGVRPREQRSGSFQVIANENRHVTVNLPTSTSANEGDGPWVIAEGAGQSGGNLKPARPRTPRVKWPAHLKTRASEEGREQRKLEKGNLKSPDPTATQAAQGEEGWFKRLCCF